MADCTRCESRYRCEIIALRDSGSRLYVLLTTTILAEITGLVGTARKDSDTSITQAARENSIDEEMSMLDSPAPLSLS